MFLKKLSIEKDKLVIREVTFRKGLNLIVDTTSSGHLDSGNNVGKSTCLRAIDYCLGAQVGTIYKDEEFVGKENELVAKLVRGGLVFKLQIETIDNEVHTIERSFRKPSRINGVSYNSTDFPRKLNEILFGVKESRPTLRQLMSKYVRIDDFSVSRTVRFIHGSTPHREYDAVYLTLFRYPEIEELETRHVVSKKVEELDSELKQLKKSLTPEARIQLLAVINDEIEECQKSIKEFEVIDGIESELSDLRDIRESISELSNKVGKLSTRLTMMGMTLEEIKSQSFNDDLDALRIIYKEVDALIPDIHVEFEDLVDFHNQLVSNKAAFVLGQIEAVEIELTNAKEKLRSHAKKEKEILKSINQKGAIEDLSKLYRKLDSLHEKKGEHSFALKIHNQVKEDLRIASEQLESVSKSIEESKGIIESNVTEFNKFFTKYSDLLYGEKFIFSMQFNPDEAAMVQPDISSTEGREGSGKKRVQVSAFDLAYLAFVSVHWPDSPRFTLHDRVEDVASKQLKILFDIAEALDGQFIVAALQEKIMMAGPSYLEECSVLKLSQSDKFFRVDVESDNESGGA